MLSDSLVAWQTTPTGPWAGQSRVQSPVILEALIRQITEDEQFMYRRIFPLEEVPDGGKVGFTQMTFNDTTLDKIPEMGVARMMTQTFRSWSASIDRQGLAFMMEDAYALTPAGLEGYKASIHGLRVATIVTLLKECYFAMLTSDNAATMNYLQRMNIVHPDATRDDVLARDVKTWCILSKEEWGYKNMSSLGKEVLANRGVVGDTLILPNGTTSYVMKSPVFRDASKVGEAGIAAFLQNRSIGMDINGYTVEETTLFKDDDGVLEDPFTRLRSVGEYFRSRHRDNCSTVPAESYKSMMRDAIVYDRMRNLFKRISLSDMAKYDGLFERNRDNGTPTGPPSEELGTSFFQGHTSIGHYLHSVDKLHTVTEAIATKLALAKSADATTKARADKKISAQWDDLVKRYELPAQSRRSDGVRIQNGPSTAGHRSQADAESAYMFGGMDTDDAPEYPEPTSVRLYTVSESDIAKIVGREDISLITMAKADKNPQGWDVIARRQKVGHWDKSMIFDVAAKLNAYLIEAKALDSVRNLAFAKCLLVQFAPKKVQRQLWSLDSSAHYREALGHVLEIVMPVEADAEASTQGVHTQWAAGQVKGAETRQPKGPRFTPSQEKDWKEYLLLLDTLYTRVNAVLPNFLAGSAVMLGQLGLSTGDIQQHVRRLVELGTIVADWQAHDVSVARSAVLAEKGEEAYGVRVGVARDGHPVAVLKRLLQTIYLPVQTLNLATVCAKSANKQEITNLADAVYEKKDSAVGVRASAFVKTLQTVVTEETNADVETAADISRGRDTKVISEYTYDGDAKGISPANIAAKLYKFPIDGYFFKFLIDCDIPYPIDYLLFRPHMVCEMSCAVFLKSGKQTGRSFFGQANFQISNDGRVKVLYGFFHCYLGAKVVNPQNIYIMPNVRSKRDVCGSGTGLYDPMNRKIQDAYKEGNMNHNSIFVIAIFPNDGQTDHAIDITGRFAAALDVASRSGRSIREPAHYSTHNLYREHWGWRHKGEALPMEFTFGIEGNHANNTICHVGHQFLARWDGIVMHDRGHRIQGTGHFGENIYEGQKFDIVNSFVRNVNWGTCQSIS